MIAKIFEQINNVFVTIKDFEAKRFFAVLLMITIIVMAYIDQKGLLDFVLSFLQYSYTYYFFVVPTVVLSAMLMFLSFLNEGLKKENDRLIEDSNRLGEENWLKIEELTAQSKREQEKCEQLSKQYTEIFKERNKYLAQCDQLSKKCAVAYQKRSESEKQCSRLTEECEILKKQLQSLTRKPTEKPTEQSPAARNKISPDKNFRHDTAGNAMRKLPNAPQGNCPNETPDLTRNE